MLKKQINDTSKNIFEYEFLREYKLLIPSIQEVVNSFEGKNQILLKSELYDILTELPLQLSVRECNLTNDKLKFYFKLDLLELKQQRNIKKSII